ncbi:MAG: two-component sensor histidine kinase [Anaeromyxobacter sp.]|nr:two-component sensor histidine kinase [Anaeromyxobacter sp.]MBL0275754.1 two-component sensor histidine kinase [Anaeromyxobacter sp.]
MRLRLRLHLLVIAAAAAATGLAALLVAGLPLLAARALGPGQLVALAIGAATLSALGGAALLFRAVGRPLDRLVEAATRLSAGDGLSPLGPDGEPPSGGLGRFALAFERTAAALSEERARLAAKVAELEAANRQLAEAREGLLRSEKLATVGRLAAGVAHEVGNPLGAIAGYAELARMKQADGSADQALVDDYLARIVAEAGRIDAIVRDLLDFARPAALDLGPVSLADALAAAVRLARVQERFRDVDLASDLAPDLPPVLADERRLSQVFLNLLLNAGDATGGRGRVRVSARLEGRVVVVALDDSGPGIPAERRAQVFDPFFTTKEPGQGTGLGLAVCHGIMASFGGAIEAGEAPGGGARLTLRLGVAGP